MGELLGGFLVTNAITDQLFTDLCFRCKVHLRFLFFLFFFFLCFSDRSTPSAGVGLRGRNTAKQMKEEENNLLGDA